MGKRYSLLLVSSCVLFFIALTCSAADEFYVTNLQVVHQGQTAESVKIEDAAKLSLLLQEELIKISTPAIVYRPLQSLPKERLGELDSKVIITTLDALAVCFFADIENLVFGTLSISENNVYEANLRLYNKSASRIVDEFVFTNPAGNEKGYWAALAAKLNEHIKLFVQSPPPKPETTEIKPVVTNTPPPKTDKLPEVKTDTTKTTEVIADTTKKLNPTADLNTPQIPEPVKPEDDNKRLLIFISGGYYFPIMDKWKEKTIPCVSIEQGVKFPSPLVETEKFDLMFDLGFLFNYSFALNKADNPYYTHLHSLTGKISLELDFEFNNFFSFFIGVGPEYKVQIIDYQNLGNLFFTQIPYAFGLFGDAGFQFIIGKDKTMAVGLTNIFDFTFFAHTYIDYKAQLHWLLRV